MKIDKDLAQQIVDQTIEVLGRNINIMDKNGIIIGSGDKKRINTFHEIAARVVKEGRTIEICPEEAGKFYGVKPGINMPIIFGDSIVGVVGITGDPNEIRNYGKIVKNMVELMLRQFFLMKEIEYKNDARNYFIRDLLDENYKDIDSLVSRAQIYGFDLDVSRAVILIEIKNANENDLRNLEQSTEQMAGFFTSEDVVTPLSANKLVILKKQQEFFKPGADFSWVYKIKELLGNKLGAEVFIGIGNPYKGLEGIRSSYQEASLVLKVISKLKDFYENGVARVTDLGTDYVLPFIPPSVGWSIIKGLFGTMEKAKEIFEDHKLARTFDYLMKSNLNVNQAAKRLFIHRNTLLYRLRVLEEKNGLNLQRCSDAFLFNFAYRLYRYLKGE
ncbi:CdaR family transcriptional regulator [Calderihabitans maritimus]|uniref:Carbohydrate diacid regulator n=1 Tax=Calderihabitans maritimus TaxID=1246530 RepID=A0A1Z5HR89_9FIRM|nr:sugar diacid recognition domain-containing protein [Calderihabitans maritimus]GAW91958.1 hypothetical protein KKC1_11180 [Calderihabitans maritimus]